MDWFEAEALLEQYNQIYQRGWEQVRYQAFITARSAGIRIKKPEELMKFSWEGGPDPEQKKLSKMSKERMAELASGMDTFKKDTDVWKPVSL